MSGPDDTDDGWGPWPDDDGSDFDDFGEPGDDRSSGFVGSARAAAGGDRIDRGVEALQVAARELIKAARSVLDMAEEVLEDPEAAVGVVTSFAQLARDALRVDWSTMAGAHGAGTEPGGRDRDDDPDDDVEHIRVD